RSGRTLLPPLLGRPDATLRLLGEQQRLHAFQYCLLGDDAPLDVRATRHLEHAVEQDVLDDRLESACPGAASERALGDGAKRTLMEDQFDIVEREELLVLLDERVLRLGEDADDVLLVEVIQRHRDRKPADELRDEAVLEQVLSLQLAEHLGRLLGPRAPRLAVEADDPLAETVLNDLLETIERPAANEQDVGRVDLDEVLVGVLAAALRRDVGHRALEDLQQCLLDPLTAHIASDRRVVALASDLVDLVDVDDAALSARDIEIGGLDQAEEDVLHVLADVAGLGEAGRVGDAEGHVEDAREGLREKRLAATGGTDEQNVRLLQLDVTVGLGVRNPLVVVEHRHGEHLFGVLLTDH